VLLVSAGSRQLAIRNNVGQLAQEVSMDIATVADFRDYATSILEQSSLTDLKDVDILEAASCGSLSPSSPSRDGYSGRTSFQGTVLLHNARADMVRRLLDRTSCPPADCSGISSPLSRSRSMRARAPFARVRQDRREIGPVGPDSFEMVRLLGRGSFGEVFQVKLRQTSRAYAMKILQKRQVFNRNLLRYAMTERNVLSYIRHPYIVSLYYAFQTASHLVMVLEFCPNGNLQNLLDRERRLQEPLARLYSAELVLALGHLHERHIVFRDLKPENIVLDESRHCMLTDFGLSKEGVMGLHGARSFCGSVAFLAPEILLQRGHGHTVDIYGIGVMLFDMLTGQPPFYHPDRETLYTNIRHARLRFPAYVARLASQFIEALMNRDPAMRLGAICTYDLQNHEFFDPIDFAALLRREVQVPDCNTFANVILAESGATSSTPRHLPRVDSPFNRQRPGTLTAASVTGWEFSTVPN